MNPLRKGSAAQISRKRKQREEENDPVPLPLFLVNVNKSRSIIVNNNNPALAPPPPAPSNTTPSKISNADQPVTSFGNRLLAGYMAYEFLTKGTLMGRMLDPAGAEAIPVGGGRAESKERYAEVAAVMKMEGAHLPGIVNPIQLSRWIQM